MNIKNSWKTNLMVLALLVGGGYFVVNGTQIFAQETETDIIDASNAAAVAIQPATTVLGQVSAAGNIELVEERTIALEVGGVIDEISVRAGDRVIAGDLLLSLDTRTLERTARQAELTVDAQRNALAQLMEEADSEDIEVAQADLLEAEENLAEVLAGPGDTEIAAANSTLSAAWAKYNETLAGPSDAELMQLDADLRKAEVVVAEAQAAYDEIAWRNDAGMTAEAANLQSATLDYESAKAAYAESTAAADQSDVHSTLSSAQDAQNALDDLLNSPTDAEIATANAKVAAAQANLDDLMNGASDSEIRDAQITLEQALIDLEKAYADLDAANVLATIDGAVLAIYAEVGENMSAGTPIVALADTSQLELTIDVAEVDIAQVSVGQNAQVEIDAFPGRSFEGVVSTIAPASEETSGVVSYPVTIRLTGDALDGVLPGMTAVAIVSNAEVQAGNGWMVPTSAIQPQGDTNVIAIVRGETSVTVEVVPGYVQGEWTMVQSPELQAGDQVLGTLTSQLDDTSEDDQRGGPFGGGPPPGGG